MAIVIFTLTLEYLCNSTATQCGKQTVENLVDWNLLKRCLY